MDQKRMIEAALFMSGRSLGSEELGRLLGVAAIGYIDKLVSELTREYEGSGSAIQIIVDGGKYSMRLRDEYSAIAKDFAKDVELSRGALKVLAYVSRNQGVMKSKVVKLLGTGVYVHVKELKEKGFVEQKRAGRSSKLMVTDKFRQYFNVVETSKGIEERSPMEIEEQKAQAQESSVEAVVESEDSGEFTAEGATQPARKKSRDEDEEKDSDSEENEEDGEMEE